MSLTGALKQNFSARSIGTGVAVVIALYALGGGFLWFKGPETLSTREDKLASQTIIIERDEIVDGESSMNLAADDALGPYDMLDEDGAVSEDTAAEIPADEHAATTPDAHATTETPADSVHAAPAHGDEHGTAPTDAHEDVHADPHATTTATADHADGLPKAPIDGLYEDTSNGRLPIIRVSDKLTPFTAYQRPFTAPVPGKPVVSIVVMNIGMSEAASKAVMSEISPEVSVAVNPYANAPDFWLNESRLTGHEAWMILPVEPDMYPMDDPGPQTLLINAVERQNINKLYWVMSRGSGYAGFVTGSSPAFMKSANDVRPVVNEIYKRGLGFVDGDIHPSTTASSIATGLNAPYAANNIWIDEPATAEHIAASLRQLEVLAQANGSAIGFINSTPMGLKMLQSWVDGLPQKGVVIAPLSAQTNKAK